VIASLVMAEGYRNQYCILLLRSMPSCNPQSHRRFCRPRTDYWCLSQPLSTGYTVERALYFTFTSAGVYYPREVQVVSTNVGSTCGICQAATHNLVVDFARQGHLVLALTRHMTGACRPLQVAIP
jgi:hypothetical protein